MNKITENRDITQELNQMYPFQVWYSKFHSSELTHDTIFIFVLGPICEFQLQLRLCLREGGIQPDAYPLNLKVQLNGAAVPLPVGIIHYPLGASLSLS